MTDDTTAAGAPIAQCAPAPPGPAETSAGGIGGEAAAGTTAQGDLGAAIAGAAGAGQQSPGATSESSPQALEEAWREQLVNDVVARLQQRALAAAPAAAAPATTPKPSLGRIVIFRDGVGNEYPGIVTCVTPTGADLQVFRNDAAAMGVKDQQQIEPTSTDQHGWFWPPRT